MHRCARHFFPEGRGKVIAHDIYGGRIAQALPLARARANARRGRLHHLTHEETSEVVFNSDLIPRTNLRLVATQRKVNPYLTCKRLKIEPFLSAATVP